jgi:two-component system, OmpR family, KDP operon response regulator KdpE
MIHCMTATFRPAPPARALLIVDDEPEIRLAIRSGMADVATHIYEAATGAEAIDLAGSERPEIIILDLGLPDMSGLEVCQAIRCWGTMPIVVLSARHSEQEKVALLEAGADDYVTKPFALRETVARVQAHLRRSRLQGAALTSLITSGELTIDLTKRTVARAGVPIHLTPTEWAILAALVTRAGRTLTHQQIYDEVWGRPFGDPQSYVRVYVTHLRRKIEVSPADPRVIITEPGVGYRAEL